MGIGAIALDTALAGATLFKTYSQSQAAQSQEEALRVQLSQERLNATNQSLQRMNKVQQVISAQNAAVGARGITPDSASVSAIQDNTFNQAARDQKIADLNSSAKESEINQEIDNTKSQETANVFGNLFDFGAASYRMWKDF